MKIKWFFLFILFFRIGIAQEKPFVSENISINSKIDGTLLLPNKIEKPPLAIIIPGSGATDRNGNQVDLNNNSLKYLAEGIYNKNIASFRYDKRSVKQIAEGTFNENDILFEDFIEDAKAVRDHFENDNRFSKIIIIGHSQGSLVGIITAQNGADKFISIAGAGREIDDVITFQLEKQAPELKDNARQAFDDLRVNGVSRSFSPELSSIFRPSLQSFMFSWMQYNPQTEIAKLDIPVLIINGDNDIQVQVSEAESLKTAKPNAQFKIIKNMNHVFKEIKGDLAENQNSYNDIGIPIMPELIKTVSSFILN